MTARPFTLVADGVRLAVKVTPKASRQAAGGLACPGEGQCSLIVKVTAPADKGAANAAVIALLAKRLRVAKRDITLVSGDTSRQKILHIAGDAGHLTRLLDAVCREAP